MEITEDWLLTILLLLDKQILQILQLNINCNSFSSNKTYNGNTTASVTLTFTGLIGSETLGQTVGATFADKM